MICFWLQYDLVEHWCFCLGDYCNSSKCFKGRSFYSTVSKRNGAFSNSFNSHWRFPNRSARMGGAYLPFLLVFLSFSLWILWFHLIGNHPCFIVDVPHWPYLLPCLFSPSRYLFDQLSMYIAWGRKRNHDNLLGDKMRKRENPLDTLSIQNDLFE